MGLKDSKISFYASSQCLGKGIPRFAALVALTSLLPEVVSAMKASCHQKKKNEWLYRLLSAQLLCSIHIAVLQYCMYFFIYITL